MYADQQMKMDHKREFVGNAAGLVGEPKRTPELPAQIDNMERGISFAADSLNELENRLGGLMRPQSTEPANSQSIGVAPPASGYASAIHEQAARVTRLGERIQDFLRRLEV